MKTFTALLSACLLQALFSQGFEPDLHPYSETANDGRTFRAGRPAALQHQARLSDTRVHAPLLA